MNKILILYYSRTEHTAHLANVVQKGVHSVHNTEGLMFRVPSIKECNQDLIKTAKDLLTSCQGLVLGSPTRFGTMASPLKFILESTSDLWASGVLAGKPAGTFTSTASMHGGQEATLLSMMLPLLHHGMLLTGVPYTVEALKNTQSGGTPYGASHTAGGTNDRLLTLDEKEIAYALGARVAKIAQKLHN